VITPQVSASKPICDDVYPISRMVCRTIVGISMYVLVVISPVTSTSPLVIAVSQATRARLSSR